MKVLAVFVLVLLLFSITPVNAAGEINPSVETIPFFCRYSVTKWSPLCPVQGPKGDVGMMNQTPNMTSIFVGSTWYMHNRSSSDLSGKLLFNRSLPTDGENVSSRTLTVAGTEYLIMQFVTEPGDPGLSALPGGSRVWHTYGNVSSIAGGGSRMKVYLDRLWIDNTTTTPMYNFTTSDFGTTISDDETTVTTIEDLPMNTTDRFLVRYYGITDSAADPVIKLYYDGTTHLSKATSPILQGLQGPPGVQGPAGPEADMSWNASYWLKDGSRKITGSTITKSVNDDYLGIFGCDGGLGCGASFIVRGANRSSTPGAFSIYTPNAAKSANVESIRITGNADTPTYAFYNLRASAATSALCYNGTTKEVTYNNGVTTCTASSEKEKKNKATVTANLTLKLMNLTPKTYTLNLDGETHYGLLAEEVATVFPELAAHNNGNTTDYSGVRYEEFTAVLLKGFQEQQKKLDALCSKHPNDCGD